ncbi:hypothetical protein QBC42DRAFT_290900 [Cladorrhinum samala]|uniref:Senescence domain-containing protein n=1 Tax=Cladorrhinum samala TaxID=585594 RepID=A0AAV9HD17_9PEZI|nr:hypothetical protein QBC42DRAFT_290900 [Cladorrhinum samala]
MSALYGEAAEENMSMVPSHKYELKIACNDLEEEMRGCFRSKFFRKANKRDSFSTTNSEFVHARADDPAEEGGEESSVDWEEAHQQIILDEVDELSLKYVGRRLKRDPGPFVPDPVRSNHARLPNIPLTGGFFDAVSVGSAESRDEAGLEHDRVYTGNRITLHEDHDTAGALLQAISNRAGGVLSKVAANVTAVGGKAALTATVAGLDGVIQGVKLTKAAVALGKDVVDEVKYKYIAESDPSTERRKGCKLIKNRDMVMPGFLTGGSAGARRGSSGEEERDTEGQSSSPLESSEEDKEHSDDDLPRGTQQTRPFGEPSFLKARWES